VRDPEEANGQGVGVTISNAPQPGNGAGFYDARKAFRGHCTLVSKRNRALSDLTVIDVIGADEGLTSYLAHLDRSRLVVRDRASGDALFSFRWASGYVNGDDIRIQGVLEHG
jgi:hypothetical protein